MPPPVQCFNFFAVICICLLLFSTSYGQEIQPQQYGPVKNGETLSHIAYQVRPDESVSIEQVMIALYRRNPGSFYRNTLDSLKIGAQLTIPSLEEIAHVDAKQAKYFVWTAPEKGVPPLTEPSSMPAETATATTEEAETLQQELAKLQQSKIQQQQQNQHLRTRITELEIRARTLLLEIQSRVQELDVLKKELEQERLKLEGNSSAQLETNTNLKHNKTK